MKSYVIAFFLGLFSTFAFAQEFEVPASFSPTGAASEYAQYQPELLKALEWLINTPPDEQTDKRKDVNGFVVGWLSGSPDVTLEINTEVLTFMDDNPQYLPIFMAGWAKYALQSKDNDSVKGTVAGINSTLAFYQKHKAILGKSKGLDAYAKQRDKGKLEDDVRKRLGR